ncbi:FAR1 DNA binding domain, zinc finger, SWIM-type, MULE transposase domain containing protein [Tanacetum coccineum]
MKELLNQVEIDVPTVQKVSSKAVMSVMLGVDEPDNILIGNPNLSKVKGIGCFSRMKPIAEVTAAELAKRRTCSVSGGKEGHNKINYTNEPASKNPKVQAAPKEKAFPKQQASQPRRSRLSSNASAVFLEWPKKRIYFWVLYTFKVEFCKSEVKLHCSCNHYEAYGLLCRHTFYVLRMNNVKDFPENYIFESTIDRLVHDLDKLHICKDKMKELLNQAEIDVPTVPKVSSKAAMSVMLGVDEPKNVLIGNPNLSKVKGTGCFSRMKLVAEVTAEELDKRRTCSVCGGKEGHNKINCTNEPTSKNPKVQAAPKEKAAPKQQASQPRRSGLRSSTPK